LKKKQKKKEEEGEWIRLEEWTDIRVVFDKNFNPKKKKVNG